METQDPISTQNQEQQAPDNANVITPEATAENDAPKMSAAELLLQRLQAHKEESITQIINEVQPAAEQQTTAEPQADDAPETIQTDENAGDTESDMEGSQSDDEEEQTETVDDLDGINYAELSKEGLIEALEKIVNRDDVHKCKTYVDYIKTLFYKQISADVEKQREKFIENGYEPKDFRATPDPLEDKL